MTAFTDWLSDSSQERVLLMELTVYSPSASPVVETRYYSSRTFITGSADTPANQLYQERISGDPFFERRMSESFSGSSFISLGEIELSNIDGGLDSWLNDSFDGRQVILKLGSPDWAISQFGTILTGIVSHIAYKSDEALLVFVKDQSQLFNTPIQEDLLASGERKDSPIPITYGNVYNIRPAKLPIGTSPETYTYQIHDGPVEDVCVQLYDKGLPSAIGVTKDNNAGTFTLATAPTGEITCDAKGALINGSPGTWITKPGAILTDIASRVGATVDATSMTALDTNAPYELGLYIYERTNAADVVDSLLPYGWYWGDQRGSAIFANLLQDVQSPSNVVLTIDELETQGDLQVEIVSPVNWQIRLGYKMNYTVNASPDDSVTEDRKEFLALEYRSASQEDTAVKVVHLDALAPDETPTQISNLTDANTEALRLLNLFKTQRTLYNVDCFVGPYQLTLGDVVMLKDTRFGLSAGVECTVVGITEYLLGNQVSLTLWR